MILYIENPKEATRKLLEIINKFGKVAGYKINTQKSLAFLYTNNKRSEREIKETVPFTIGSKRIKYWGINPSKEIKGFPAGSDGKESACKAGGLGWIPGLGRSPGEGDGYSL